MNLELGVASTRPGCKIHVLSARMYKDFTECLMILIRQLEGIWPRRSQLGEIWKKNKKSWVKLNQFTKLVTKNTEEHWAWILQFTITCTLIKMRRLNWTGSFNQATELWTWITRITCAGRSSRLTHIKIADEEINYRPAKRINRKSNSQ